MDDHQIQLTPRGWAYTSPSGLVVELSKPRRALHVTDDPREGLTVLWPIHGHKTLRLSVPVASYAAGALQVEMVFPDGTRITPPGPAKTGWTLRDAQAFVAGALWQPLYDAGWVPCLTGGVLRRGWSEGDLDIVLYARTPQSSVEAARAALARWEPTWGDWDYGHVGTFMAYGRQVEVVIPAGAGTRP